MSYREFFIEESKKNFAMPLLHEKTRKASEELINVYFTSIFDSLREEAAVAGDRLKFSGVGNRWVVSYDQATLIVEFGDQLINVNISSPDTGMVGSDDQLVFENGSYNSRTYGQTLSEDLLDIYLKEAFGYYLK